MKNPPPSFWAIKNLAKSFDGKPALRGVSLELAPGQVLALLGEDGAGKSTLAKILAGVIRPDGGEIRHGEEILRVHDLPAAQKAGIAVLFDEPALAANLSVAENLYLGMKSPAMGGALLDWTAMRRQARRQLEDLGLHIDPRRPAYELSPYERRLVEFARVFACRPSLLVLDETAVGLSADELISLNGIIRRGADQGAAVLYLSDRPEDALPLADSLAFLRGGEITEPSATGLTPLEAASAMAGLDLGEVIPHESHAADALCLEARGLCTASGLKDVSFDLQRGEVLGLSGPGALRLARAVAGLEPLAGGGLALNGRKLRFKEPADALRAGLGITRAERDAGGCLLQIEKPAGFSFSRLGESLQAPFLEMDWFGGIQTTRQADLSPASLRRAIRFLSGGGSEKKRVARWLTSQARVLVLLEPTRGLEAGGRLFFYRVVDELTAAGISLILVDSVQRELSALSDRILEV